MLLLLSRVPALAAASSARGLFFAALGLTSVTPLLPELPLRDERGPFARPSREGDRAASLFDFLSRRSADLIGFNLERMLQFAVAQNLDPGDIATNQIAIRRSNCSFTTVPALNSFKSLRFTIAYVL